MVGILINKNYRYEDATLNSGAKVSASQVTIKDGKVDRVENGNVTINEKTFGFSVYNYGFNGEKTYNYNSVPEGMNPAAYVDEFIAFVEADMV